MALLGGMVGLPLTAKLFSNEVKPLIVPTVRVQLDILADSLHFQMVDVPPRGQWLARHTQRVVESRFGTQFSLAPPCLSFCPPGDSDHEACQAGAVR